MTRSKHILAVMAVTVALCADQVVSATPLPRTPVAEMAARLVTRLSQSFARTAATDIRSEVRRRGSDTPSQTWEAIFNEPTVTHRAVTPFQFRLPPPSL
jgi:hypothetical protein